MTALTRTAFAKAPVADLGWVAAKPYRYWPARGSRGDRLGALKVLQQLLAESPRRAGWDKRWATAYQTWQTLNHGVEG